MKPVSFDVNHLMLERGVYLSQTVILGNYSVVTLDVRMCKPYADYPMTVEQAHSFEHALATLVRNFTDRSNISTVYVGPMGCLTGFYLVFAIKNGENVIFSEWFNKLVEHILHHKEDPIPANSKLECGNCTTLSEEAKNQAFDMFESMWRSNPGIRHYPGTAYVAY